jgi:hypothetical protein
MVGTYGSDSASSSSPRFRFPSRADMTLACVGHTQNVGAGQPSLKLGRVLGLKRRPCVEKGWLILPFLHLDLGGECTACGRLRAPG